MRRRHETGNIREAHAPLRIFYLAQRVPFPPQRGDKIATYNQVSFLGQRHEVEVFCLADGQDDLVNVDGLRTHARIVHAVPLSRLRARLRALSALFRGRPLTTAYFSEKELQRILDDRCRSAPPDLVIIYSSGMASYVEGRSDMPRIMQFADLDSMKWREYAKRARSPMRWVYRLEAGRLFQYERKLATSFSHSVVCTESERRDLELAVPGVNASCVSNGVDIEFFKPIEAQKRPQSLVFTGVMDYYPNVDGVLWFCEDILPLIRSAYPGARLTICGSRPTKSVRALAKTPGITVTGWVPDIRACLAAAEVAIVPLRIARGIQNKLLEAMAMGLPCVTTPMAAMGVRALAGREMLVADNASGFADHVIRLLGDPAIRQHMGSAARQAMEAGHSWEVELAGFETIIRAAVDDQKQDVQGRNQGERSHDTSMRLRGAPKQATFAISREQVSTQGEGKKSLR